LREGFTDRDITVLGKEEVLRQEAQHSETTETAGEGAALGSITRLLVGATPMLLPGVGP